MVRATVARIALASALATAATLPATPIAAQPFSLNDILGYGFAYSLVSATGADRIAWIENEEGRRNIFTAAAPDFAPVRLTSWMEDDGHDLQELQLSADGEIVAFLRGHAPNSRGWVANPTSDPRGAERAVWAMSTRGGNAWRVVEATNFTLSPDGRWVLYTKDDQIHRAPVNSGLAQGDDAGAPLFLAWGENGDPTWSPDGSRVAFESDRDDHGYIGVYDARSPSITYLTPGVDRDSSPTWSPDGTRVAFIRRPGANFGQIAQRPSGVPASAWPDGMVQSRFPEGHTLEIWIADAATGEGERLWAAPANGSRFNSISQIHWRDDHILFEAEPGNWRHWFSVSVDDPRPDPIELSAGDGFVMQTAFSADGRWLYYSSNHTDIDRRDLWRVRVDGTMRDVITEGDAIETYPAVLASGNQVATLYAEHDRPQSVAIVSAVGGGARVITNLPERFPRSAHVAPVNVTLTAEDGMEFNNQLFLPPDLEPGERRPALIFIHGGSRRQMLLGYHHRGFYHMAYAMNQYFANQGYVVLSVNYRSGIGYGREFRNAPGRGGQGNTEYRDIIAAGRWLQTRADVDPERVGLWGLSYGGVLTAQGLARNSDVFKAGVDIAGVHLWGNTIDPDATSYQSSVIGAIEGWESPVLLIHGDDDRNVAFSQTTGLVQLLRAQGVEYELHVFPDDVHSSLLHERWVKTFELSDDFLQRKLVGDAWATQGGGDR